MYVSTSRGRADLLRHVSEKMSRGHTRPEIQVPNMITKQKYSLKFGSITIAW